ncbi:nucleoprotein TPR isoform X3 [Dunckerocampus dactyliophorus]|uniref:nucleoprotein TPR isoform X3 n=1 Tax=Dunckerocampus dactyliophorus TaxID=161453 RepID=UPI002404B45F|nr:nucleoprotein TPR isoform X3 [Dunckerocampus dactyliophorus]
MSFKENPCRKFQANIFNKSKCQNCFKPRESHLLNDEDLNQAKPVYGGWLLLAPEGTNFDNPLHRSRKWQRRFFILYEHGLLRYALDEMPSTLPQGTINMNQCSDVIDGASRTGQKNSLCILTPEKEHFIRAECKEIINGWQEALTVYPRTNKQNQKKKRKVEPPTQQSFCDRASHFFLSSSLPLLPSQTPIQEPGPAKVTVTSSGSSGGSIPCLPSSIASADHVPMSRATLWQEENRWSRATIPCSRSASCLSQLGQSQPDTTITTQDDGGTLSSGRKVRVESGYFSLEKTKSEPSPQPAQHSQPLHPPHYLPLSSSTSSCSLGAPSPRYNSEPEPPICPYPHSQDPLPSPDALVSPSYSTISSSQSSLDSEHSSATPTWEGRSGGGGSIASVSSGGGRVGRSGREYAALSDVPRARRLTYREAFHSEKKRQELRARTRSPGREEVARLFGEERRRSQVIGRFEESPNVERMDTSSSSELSSSVNNVQRQGRSERRYLDKHDMSLDAGKDHFVPDVSSSTFANLRRAKSLDRRVTESSMTPDLLNFKKGWMTKLYEDGMWKKHWFVLTDQSLRYYKDSIAEEASQLDGEIDLSTCYDVKEFPVQRNYGFQILCKEGACTLSAMTSGIRRNWIQAIMKNARPTIAPDVTRKNISLKLSVLKPRSIPEEKIKAQVLLEPCPQITPEPSPVPEPTKNDGHRQPTGNGASTPPSEPRKSRVRERRREGRSKTFDWSEFKIEKTDKTVKERADTVDLSSSLSTTTSCCSISSSPSSSMSSPVSTSALQSSCVSDTHPPSTVELTEKNNLRRGTVGANHLPNTATVTSTLNTTSPLQPPIPECQEQGKIEVDHPTAIHNVEEDKFTGTSGVQEEIEQRWHQVETTPLREEKQVPITSASGNPDRLPPHELAALLDKELGQKQKELDQLQRQNRLLKEQLEDALGREHSAREGYVLQNTTAPTSLPHRMPWKHLHKLNQDLQSELQSQKRKQDLTEQQIHTLKRSYTEAQDAVDHHEADIQALQAKLASALAEILASEQAVARMRNELKLEQERSKEQEEEHRHSEATLRAQLKDSEDRLREVEASLLERNQALRHLEHQQALQRDHTREIQRLQERLQEVTARLVATEEGQALKEERLRKEQHGIQESHERERQNLCRRIAEAETAQKGMEDRLLEAEQQVEALLRGQQASARVEYRQEMLKVQEELAQKTNTVESLRESVRRLEEERGLLTCRCQELLNQIAEADREVNKLRNRLEAEEADYCSLENSYERATQEFQRMSQFLREKEEEIRQTKEMYERLMERKEEDLREALVKMTVLGNSLEETEQKLQAKEDLLCQMSQGLVERVEPGSAEQDLKAKLVVAEDRIAELEQHLNDLQLGYSDLHSGRKQVQEQSKRERVFSSKNAAKMENSTDDKASQATKRPRIRFSNIQCQKYIDLDDPDSCHMSSTLEYTRQVDNQKDFDVAEALPPSDTPFSHASDSEKFISIVHALETKLLTTEEKLRNLTKNLQEQRTIHVEDVSKKDLNLVENHPYTDKDLKCACGPPVNNPYAKALHCVETSQNKVKAILSGTHDTTDSQLHSLSEVENELLSASMYIRHGQKTLEEQSPAPPQMSESLDKDTVHLFAKTLSFEALVLNKMALLVQSSDSDLVQTLTAMWEDIENIKSDDKDCLAIVYADVLTRKLMLENAFWKELEKETTPCEGSNVAKSQEASVAADADINTSAVFNTLIKAELSYSIQNLKLCYEDKFRQLKGELAEAHHNLQQREMALKAIIEASKRSDLKSVIKEVKSNFGFGKQKLADIRPPELAPYTEQIELQDARELAEKILERHFAEQVPSCGVDSIESLQDAHDSLATELQHQAAKLYKYAEEIQSSGNHPELAKMVNALLGPQTSNIFTSASLCMREALNQAQVAYVACRLRSMHERNVGWCKQTHQNMGVLVQQHACSVRAIHEKYRTSLQEERHNFSQTLAILQKENKTLKSEVSQRSNQLSQQQEQLMLLEEHFKMQTEELKQKHKQELNLAEKERASTELALVEATTNSQQKLKDLLLDMDTMKKQHLSHVRKLEEQFVQKISQLEHVYKEEIVKLHSQHEDNICNAQAEDPEVSHQPSFEASAPMEEEEQGSKEGAQIMSEVDTMVLLKDRIQELETQMNSMRDELENKHMEADVASLREKYQRDFESLKATCERGFAAMEDTHQKVIDDLQRQHQREISKLIEERERLLAEETAATIAAIEAMKNAHKEELEKTQRSQLSGQNSDIDELRSQYKEELQSIQRELEVLSEQYSQKCLENAHLAQALEAERQALRQCQRENQELNTHNQELNNRLSAEITRMRSCFSGETALSPVTQGKDVYELEVLLRIKESEIQYLKQEIHSLKDELQSALRDKKYATDKYKDIYTELSIVKAKADCDIGKLKEKLLIATEALGERTVDGTVTSGYDIMKSKSNPDFMKKEQSTLPKSSRGVRSKVSVGPSSRSTILARLHHVTSQATQPNHIRRVSSPARFVMCLFCPPVCH